MSWNGLHVLRAGMFSLVVDVGRARHRGDGVPRGGAMDAVSYGAANRLAGNDEGAAAVEIAYGDVSVRFEGDARFALAGADCVAELQGERVDSWGSYAAASGDVLTMRRPRSGVRSYLAVAGGIDVPLVLGARDTSVAAGFGGYEGRALREGDRLPFGPPVARALPRDVRVRCEPPAWQLARGDGAATVLRLIAAGDYARLSAAQRALLVESEFAVGPQSNRMGARLTGTRIELEAREIPSHAVFAGVVQLPPSGEPIVLLADAQTTGGYPRLGCVVEADLWKLAQVPAGARVRFELASLEQAAQARREIAAYLERVEEGRP